MSAYGSYPFVLRTRRRPADDRGMLGHVDVAFASVKNGNTQPSRSEVISAGLKAKKKTLAEQNLRPQPISHSVPVCPQE